MKILSIIIPVYNAQDYIVDTVNSVLYNMPSNVEIIIINDGSTDNSVSLIKKEFSEYIELETILFIDQDNAGVSCARNVGINKSRGEYITFVDADDLLADNYYDVIFPVLTQYTPDIIEFGCTKFVKTEDINSNPTIFTQNNFGLLKTEAVIGDVFAQSIFYTPLRIINKQILKDLKFPVGVAFCEDMIFLYQLYQQSDIIYHIDKSLYAYRDNIDGATRNIKPDYLEAMLALYLTLLKDTRPEVSYLKVNVFYIIYRCSHELGKGVYLPFNIFIDSKKLVIKFLFDKKIPRRKKMILFMPNIYKKIVALKSYYKSRG